MVSITVIIPTFNRSRSVVEAALSALSQEGNFDLTVVIVDDGSTDDTEKAISALAINHRNLTYIKTINTGACHARNVGIDAASSDYVAFLDSDDVYLPGHLSNVTDFFTKNELYDVYFSIVKVQRDDSNFFYKPSKLYVTGDDMSEYLLCDRGFVPTITLAVRTSVAKMVKYDQNLKMGQDTDFAIRLFANGAKIFCSEHVGAIWNDYIDPNRVSNNKNFINRVEWQNRNLSKISSKARRADFGWHIAKSMRANGLVIKPIFLCLFAIFSGCYKPKLALSVFLQVLLSKKKYRALADFLARRGINP